ncbi:MAG: FTR1 family protein [Zoogloeaceae bacterium]|jgi:high-affinity iron transporter|nr:FTR1 family protein [Zoogloeaceae bacterium]
MQNAFFVVWRESLEALLVIGILYAWLNVNDPGGKGKRALFVGIAVGIGLALFLGWGLMNVQEGLAGEALQVFQISILCVAAILITQMVIWMSLQGRAMKAHLENRLEQAQQKSGSLGVLVVAALAVAREGAETIIFLYSLAQGGKIDELLIGAIGGFAAAIFTAWLAAKSLGRLNIGLLLRISSMLLLILASSLLVSASDRLTDMIVESDRLMHWMPALVDELWDSSGLIDDSGGIGRVLADFAGYRAHPVLSNLLVWGGYWLLTISVYFFLVRRGKRSK